MLNLPTIGRVPLRRGVTDMAKKKDVVIEEPEVTCPVCGKPVGEDVPSCPYCGAEFEEESEEAAAEPAAAVAEAEGTAECPVCGKAVSLSVTSCPNCGAEFEEEEVEEVIEVEEKTVPQASRRREPEPVEEEVAEVGEEVEVAEEPVELEGPSSIMDLRVIGIALVVLGIIGSQVSFMIDWYWTWVPPIKDNLGMFIAIPAVIIVVGLLVFMMIKKAAGSGKKVPRQMPGVSLSLFLFGILALVLMLLWDPVNSALQDSSAGVGGGFVLVLVIGGLLVFMGMKQSARATA